MKNSNTNFDELISMIKASTIEDGFKAIAVKELYNNFVYGKMMHGMIQNPFELNVIDKTNLCQNLYDCLITEFGEQLCPGYSHSFDGSYQYFMTLNDNIIIFFPSGYEYEDWIFNQIQIDNAKSR